MKKVLTSIMILALFCVSIHAQSITGKSTTSGVTIENDFCDNTVLVVLKQEASGINRSHNKNQFSGVAISEIKDLTYITGDVRRTLTNQENFKQILKLTLTVKSKENVLKAVEQLQKLNNVESAEPNYIWSMDLVPNDYDNSILWGLEKIQAPLAWDISTGSHSIKVGISDTGIASHPDLNVNVTAGWNCYTDSSVMGDLLGDHGTHVAGTVGAVGDNKTGVVGVNWNVSLVPLRIDHNGQSAYHSSMVTAVNYARNNNIPIINMSFAGYGSSVSLQEAIKGYSGLFVWSAGNSFANNDVIFGVERFYNTPNIIAVGATMENDDKSYFSAYGKDSVPIFAPGSNIYSTVFYNIYGFKSGTSMAAPHVAGAAALVLSAKPNLTAVQLRNILIHSADNITISSEIGNHTVKRLNVANAITNANNVNYVIPIPPRDLTANVSGNNVTLNWYAITESTGLQCYKVYKDGVLLSNTGLSTNFTDINIPSRAYKYSVVAVYSSGDSTPISTRVTVGMKDFCLGTGNDYNNLDESGPINIYYRSVRGQFVYTAQELNNAGIYGPVKIGSIGFGVVYTPTFALPSYHIRIKHTKSSDASSHDYGPFEVTHIIPSYTTAYGMWNKIDLPEAFQWNGTDNILFDTAFGLVPDYREAGAVTITHASNGYRFCTSDDTSMVNSVTTSVYQWKPNLVISTLTDGTITPPTVYPIPYSQNFNSENNFYNGGWGVDINLFGGIHNTGVNGSNALTMNIYSGSLTQYAHTPIIGTITTETKLSFVYRFVEYETLLATELGSKDVVHIEVSSTGATGEYTIIHSINRANHFATSSFTPITKSLSAFSGKDINIRFRAEDGSGDYYFILDDVKVNNGVSFPVFSISPASKDFGSVSQNKTSESQIFTIKNTGEDGLIIKSIELSGKDSEHFILDYANESEKILNSYDSFTFNVKFSPLSVGEKEVNIKIVDNLSRAVYSVPLSGQGMITTPGEVGLALPLNGATDVSLSPTFIWQQPVTLGNPDGYVIYLGYSANPYDSLNPENNRIAVIEGMDNTTWTYNSELEKDVIYHWQIVAYNQGGMGEASSSWLFQTNSISETDITLKVKNTELISNYPNPFNPETSIKFALANSSSVVIDIFDIRGRKVRSLVNENFSAGVFSVVWNGKDDNGKGVSSGIYFCRMNTAGFSATKRMLLIK